MAVDVDWAIGEIDSFLELTELHRPPDPYGVVFLGSELANRGRQEAIVASAHVVEQIFGRVMPNWRTEVPADRNHDINRWCQHIEAAQRVRTALLRQVELREKLGDDAPQLDAARLHPWIWEGARSLWQSGHYREAVRVACVKLNAETQNKVNRRDIAEIDLFNQVFSADPPQPGKPRLHVAVADGSKTFTSLQRGVRCFAEGCYAAIRNPISHSVGDLAEDEALEQLAALSVLARWVDQATLTT
ncbi:TIGR02391 family protein [Actinosynnema pretiosum]|uniref:Restriction endonuclease n=1 Tax=Actinosynnema pretiosum TaxID=42197 RepID=A0A290Z4Y2_9PSEU|nr:TIGR02391 family protein [Actinosynnema pretiosum]ATE54042.1 restriction endonuclease [Actinosynnema pretiosum]